MRSFTGHPSWPWCYTFGVRPNGPKWPQMAILGDFGPFGPTPNVGHDSHDGCHMKDIIKTSTAVKTRSQLDFWIKSYDQKTIFFHFSLKNRLFYLLKIWIPKMLRHIFNWAAKILKTCMWSIYTKILLVLSELSDLKENGKLGTPYWAALNGWLAGCQFHNLVVFFSCSEQLYIDMSVCWSGTILKL